MSSPTSNGHSALAEDDDDKTKKHSKFLIKYRRVFRPPMSAHVKPASCGLHPVTFYSHNQFRKFMNASNVTAIEELCTDNGDGVHPLELDWNNSALDRCFKPQDIIVVLKDGEGRYGPHIRADWSKIPAEEGEALLDSDEYDDDKLLYRIKAQTALALYQFFTRPESPYMTVKETGERVPAKGQSVPLESLQDPKYRTHGDGKIAEQADKCNWSMCPVNTRPVSRHQESAKKRIGIKADEESGAAGSGISVLTSNAEVVDIPNGSNVKFSYVAVDEGNSVTVSVEEGRVVVMQFPVKRPREE